MVMEVVNNVIGRVLDILFSAAKREIDYVRKCTENVQHLRNEAQKLKDMKGRVQQQIGIAKGNGDDLVHGVQEWVDKAIAEISTADRFFEEEANANKTCFNLRACVNLSTLYRYSKTATKMVTSVRQHHEAGNPYENNVSIPAPTPGFLELYERKNLDDIHTQKLNLEKIIEAINDESKQIIGIYGSGGVGKTTLAKEVAATMKGIFADVVFLTISHQVNVENIKKEVEVAAKRVIKNEKILIILDDVWGELKLDEMGIPCGSRYTNCKILFTCRSRNVCTEMGAKSEICVNPLPNKEAWILFKGVAGERVETDTELGPIAREVVEECGGLPLIIQAVGKALENKDNSFWKSALDRLKNHAPLNIDQGIRRAFLHLELSYNLLESEEAKQCFLLCSMFPEDALIPLERLAYYGVGLGNFKDLDSIEDARDRVRIAVTTLKSSFLLLDGDDKSTTKMHDIVRDVALLIASQGQNNFSVKAGTGLTEWRPYWGAIKNYTGISLMRNDICKLPNHEFDCPLLNTLLLQENRNLSTISDEFIRGVKEVRVLDMECNNISSLPKSLALLTKLCMLNLGGNKNMKGISVLGELRYLEILILNNTGIEEIPQEMGQLEYLRRLEVKCCNALSHIAPGVISKLHGLEELHIGYYSVQEGNYNSLTELSNLSRLTFLNLFVPNLDLIPEGVRFGTISRFYIEIGGHESLPSEPVDLIPKSLFQVVGESTPWELHSKRHLILRTPFLKIPLLTRIRNLIEVSNDILLESVENLNDILPNLYYEGFDRLKSIALSECNNLSCLVDTRDWDQRQTFHSLERLIITGLKNLSQLCYGDLLDKLFIKLRHIVVSECHELQTIVSCNMPHVFQGIETLRIDRCSSIRCIFECKDLDGGKINEKFLSKLEHLHLARMSRLEVIWNCSDQYISLSNLVTISIAHCRKLRRLFSLSVAQGLVHLQMLDIFSCIGLENVIWDGHEDEVGVETIVFPCLAQIFLSRMHALKSFCSGHSTIKYPSLVNVDIRVCGSMKIWGYGVQDTPKLKLVNDVPLDGPFAINDAVKKRLQQEFDKYQDPVERLTLRAANLFVEVHD